VTAAMAVKRVVVQGGFDPTKNWCLQATDTNKSLPKPIYGKFSIFMNPDFGFNFNLKLGDKVKKKTR
jgi:hypothetical protein